MINLLKASVIIATHNKAEYLNLTLAGYVSQVNKEFEIIIINDGSTDNTMEIVNAYQNELNIYYIEIKHLGKSYARNLGLDSAKSEIIIIADDDRIPSPNFVEEHIIKSTISSNTVHIGNKFAVYTKYSNEIKIRNSDFLLTIMSKLFPDLESFPPKKNTMLVSTDEIINNFEDTINKIYAYEQYDNYGFIQKHYGAELEGFYIGWSCATTANLSFNRVLGNEIRFDTNFVGWGMQDIEFSYQLSKKGYKFAFAVDAVNYHQLHERKTGELKQLMSNMSYFCNKHKSLDAFLHVLPFESANGEFTFIDSNDLYIALQQENSEPLIKILNFMKSIWIEKINKL